jgi:hypothetical protein
MSVASLPSQTINRACCMHDSDARDTFLWRAHRRAQDAVLETRASDLLQKEATLKRVRDERRADLLEARARELDAHETALKQVMEKRMAEWDAEQRASPSHYLDGRVRRKTAQVYADRVAAEKQHHKMALSLVQDGLRRHWAQQDRLGAVDFVAWK